MIVARTLLALGCLLAAAPAHAADPFVDEVVAFAPGTQAGFGQETMPGIVLGPPRGAGAIEGSLDVVSLGNGGEIVVRFTETVACDAEGVDFTIFENAFHAGSETGPVFAEVGIVAVSQDGEAFYEFPYDGPSLTGFAGLAPVYSHPDNDIDPTDPGVSGGDAFDLADVGLPWAAYVRITDPGAAIPDPGNTVPPGNQGGFDLDAIAIVNECAPQSSTTTTVTVSTVPQSSTTSTTIMDGGVCGDGILDVGEACDDGDTEWIQGEACAHDCFLVACADPNDSGSRTASDALFMLAAAVGLASCDLCLCDVDDGATAGVTASDALLALRVAVGVGDVAVACPACAGGAPQP